MPANTIYVGRPTLYGNPFRPYLAECCGHWDVVDDNEVTYLVDHGRTHERDYPLTTKAEATRKAVELYDAELTYWFGGRMQWDPVLIEAVRKLRGHNLACWCPLDQPCHADVLLEIANGGAV